MRNFWLGFAALAVVWGCASKPTEQVIISEGPRHPVTKKMSGVTDQLSAKDAPSFSLKGTDGKTYSSADVLKSGPMVVISIKEGCPCSTDSQPLFNELSKRHQGKATFIGLYNEDIEKGKIWVEQKSVPYPVLIDHELKTIKDYAAERSVYVTLVDPEGKIVKVYPGYWKDMLVELDRKLGELTQTKLDPFDPKYAPNTPSSGCQLYVGEGFSEGDVP